MGMDCQCSWTLNACSPGYELPVHLDMNCQRTWIWTASVLLNNNRMRTWAINCQRSWPWTASSLGHELPALLAMNCQFTWTWTASASGHELPAHVDMICQRTFPWSVSALIHELPAHGAWTARAHGHELPAHLDMNCQSAWTWTASVLAAHARKIAVLDVILPSPPHTFFTSRRYHIFPFIKTKAKNIRKTRSVLILHCKEAKKLLFLAGGGGGVVFWINQSIRAFFAKLLGNLYVCDFLIHFWFCRSSLWFKFGLGSKNCTRHRREGSLTTREV
jgi:hypothetical protein